MEQSSQYRRQLNRNKLFGKYGNMYGTWFDSRGVPRISLGPHWPMYFCLSSFLSIIGFGCTFWLAPQIHPALAWAGLLSTIFCVGSYTTAAFSNPGIALATHDDLDEGKMMRYCKICEIYQKQGTEHCDDCALCIEDYDHHCPWTSKCIGKGNIVWFYCFLIGLFGMIIFASISFSWGLRAYKVFTPRKRGRMRGTS